MSEIRLSGPIADYEVSAMAPCSRLRADHALFDASDLCSKVRDLDAELALVDLETDEREELPFLDLFDFSSVGMEASRLSAADLFFPEDFAQALHIPGSVTALRLGHRQAEQRSPLHTMHFVGNGPDLLTLTGAEHSRHITKSGLFPSTTSASMAARDSREAITSPCVTTRPLSVFNTLAMPRLALSVARESTPCDDFDISSKCAATSAISCSLPCVVLTIAPPDHACYSTSRP